MNVERTGTNVQREIVNDTNLPARFIVPNWREELDSTVAKHSKKYDELWERTDGSVEFRERYPTFAHYIYANSYWHLVHDVLIDPVYAFCVETRYHWELCKFMQDGTIPYKAIFVARAHMKTFVTSVCGHMWDFVQDPNVRILQWSGSDLLCGNILRSVKRQLDSNQRFKKYFPHIAVDPKKKPEVWNSKQAILPYRSIELLDASITIQTPNMPMSGSHYDKISIDDAVNKDNYQSEKKVSIVNKGYDELYQLADPGAPWSVRGTMWVSPIPNVNDKVMQEITEPTEHSMPWILFQRKIREARFGYGTVNENKEVEPEYIWPKETRKHGDRVLIRGWELKDELMRKERLSPSMFRSQYYLERINDADRMFDMRRIRLYNEDNMPAIIQNMRLATLDVEIIFDMAYKTAKHNDESAMRAYAVHPKGWYFYGLRGYSGRFRDPIIREKLLFLYQHYKQQEWVRRVRVWIENVNKQYDYIKLLMRDIMLVDPTFVLLPLNINTRTEGKAQLIGGMSNIVESGHFFMPMRDNVHIEDVEFEEVESIRMAIRLDNLKLFDQMRDYTLNGNTEFDDEVNTFGLLSKFVKRLKSAEDVEIPELNSQTGAARQFHRQFFDELKQQAVAEKAQREEAYWDWVYN